MPNVTLGRAGDGAQYTSCVSINAAMNNPVDDLVITIISTGGFVDSSTVTWNFPNANGVGLFIQVQAGLSAYEYYAANPGSHIGTAVLSTHQLPGMQCYMTFGITLTRVNLSPLNQFTDGIRTRSANVVVNLYGCTGYQGRSMGWCENSNAQINAYSCIVFGVDSAGFRCRSNGVGTMINCDVTNSSQYGFHRTDPGGSMTVRNCRAFGCTSDDFRQDTAMVASNNASEDATAPGTGSFPNESQAVHYVAANDTHWPGSTDSTLYPGVAPDGVYDFDWDNEARPSVGNTIGMDFVAGTPPTPTGVTTLVSTQPLQGALVGDGGLAR